MRVGTAAACFITHKTAMLPLKNVFCVRRIKQELILLLSSSQRLQAR
jgi:hypothetical protein